MAICMSRWLLSALSAAGTLIAFGRFYSSLARLVATTPTPRGAMEYADARHRYISHGRHPGGDGDGFCRAAGGARLGSSRNARDGASVSYTHLRAHETVLD